MNYYDLEDVQLSKELHDIPTFCCPNCDGDYTHHEKTIVHGFEGWWEKNGEKVELDDMDWEEAQGHPDYTWETKGIGISTDPSEMESKQVDIDNPSHRRDAVSIYFSCEFCPEKSVLRIIQHKGNTFIGTEVIEQKDPYAKMRKQKISEHPEYNVDNE